MKHRNPHAQGAWQRRGGAHRSRRVLTEREAIEEQEAGMNVEEWVAMVEAKMARGRQEYGDASFSRPPSEIVAEITEEAIDACGWGFVLWQIKHGVPLDNPLRGLRSFIYDSYHASAWPPPERMDANRFAVWAASMGARVAEQADRLRREGEG